MSVTYHDIKDWLGLTKSAVDLLKSAAAMVPKGDRRAAIEAKITEAEDMLKRSDAKLAYELGLKLCDCTFPPNVMLWKESEKAHVCPDSACGRKKYQGMRVSQEALDFLSRQGPRGPHSWMAK
jgi:hypothetical protein